MATNPVIPGFFPDPTICRVGEDYYLACSSFEYFPGVPLFHSRDLSSWRQIGNILDRPSQLPLATAWTSGGVYAPTLRHHDDRFWMITTNLTDGGGHFLVTADDPAGPWSDPVHLTGLPGIDPDLAWDEEGTCWCTFSVFVGPDGKVASDGGIWQAPIDPRSGEVLDAPHRLWSGTGLVAPEAPHLYRIDGMWYLLIAEGGTSAGHAVSVARGPAVSGPFEGCPANPILSHRSTNLPFQNTGHGDLVQTPDGAWRMVLLGTRPRGGFPGWHVLGRETLLTTVSWVDGWPMPERVAESVPVAESISVAEEPPAPAGPLRDDFDAPALAPEWISVRQRPEELVDLAARPGWLTLRASGDTLDGSAPTFVGRRQQHPGCRVSARIDPGDGVGGLVVRMDERHHYRVEADADTIRCVARIGPLTQQVATAPVGGGPIVLTVETGPRRGYESGLTGPPDTVRLGVGHGDGFTVLAELDGRYLSTEVAGGFTGRVIGLSAIGGTVAFDWYEYQEGLSPAG